MANTKAGGAGEAQDGSVTVDATTDGEFEEGSQEAHDEAIKAKLREAADAAVEAAERSLEKQKAHLAGAEQALKEAKAEQAKGAK